VYIFRGVATIKVQSPVILAIVRFMRYKKIKITGVIATFFLVFAQPGYAQLAAVSGPISGEHGNTSTCDGCHGSGVYTATATLSGPTTILHGANSATFNLNGTGGTRRGFNIAIYRVTGNVKQTTAFNTLSAGIYTPNSNNELQHGVAQNINDWSFKWTAPATLGSYRIYACVNPVNNTGSSAGDGDVACDTYNFSVTNSNPNAIDDTNAITVIEGSGLSALFNPLTDNDLTTEGDAFSWFSTTDSVTGTLTDNSNGTYRYNPDGLFNYLSQAQVATTTFDYTIEEDSYAGYRDTATATIRITGVNDRPVAVDDGTALAPFVTVQEGMAVDNGTDGDGGNNDLAFLDTDVDTNDNKDATRTGCPAGVTDPLYGTITNFDLDGTFTYTHDNSNTIADSFTYCTIDDSGTGTNKSSNSATVFIKITPVNDSPTISTSAGSTAFTEQTPVVVDSNLTLVDGDSTEFSGATAQVTGNPQAGDQLACGALPAGISCSVPGTTLTLSSATTSLIADYETALEAVTFTSSSDNPDLGARTITFIVEDDLSAFSTAIPAATKGINPISRTNDPPAIDNILDQVAFEDTTDDPYTFTYTAVATDVDVNDDTNTGNGSLTYSLSGQPAGMTISNTNPTHGQISWNPPITGYPATAYGPITVSIEDGNEDVSPVLASTSFSVTVSPPDGDVDGFENYNDFCPTTNSATNLDFDGDGTPGSDGGPPDILTDFTGGDDCDADDDGDLIPDQYEDENSMNPFDASDAAADNDGDGISNFDEYNNGTNPNLVNLAIDATGYFTPYDLVPPEPTSIHLLATAVTANDYGPYRPGDNTITWTPSNGSFADLSVSDAGNLVSTPPEQPFSIRPLLSFGADQVSVEGETATVTLYLNGEAPTYPVTVNYSISGTATAADYTVPMPLSGVTQFAVDTTPLDITFDLTAADGSDPGETVIFTIDSATNAAIGSSNTHRVTIVEGNVAPSVALQFSQGGQILGSTYFGEGAVAIKALVSDGNSGQVHSYDWSRTDNSLTPPVATTPVPWAPTIPVAGNYLIDVVVTDNGSPPASTRITRILHVAAGTAPAALALLADSDGDGIPGNIDSIDGLVGGGNLIPDQTVDPSESLWLETEPGLTLVRGSTTQAASRFGALLNDSDIESFGSVRGDAPVNGADSFSHVGGIYDFEIRGLIPGSSASIVIPLQSAIPRDGVYRKFNPATGWADFVINNNNLIASAYGDLGACPEPGSSAYRSGLQYLDNCIQLTIQDGGPNDTDNTVNGVINDPSTVGVKLTDPETAEVEDGSGKVSPLLLVILLSLVGFAFWRRRRGFAID
jgi:VCBS repeat-containing protein